MKFAGESKAMYMQCKKITKLTNEYKENMERGQGNKKYERWMKDGKKSKKRYGKKREYGKKRGHGKKRGYGRKSRNRKKKGTKHKKGNKRKHFFKFDSRRHRSKSYINI